MTTLVSRRVRPAELVGIAVTAAAVAGWAAVAIPLWFGHASILSGRVAEVVVLWAVPLVVAAAAALHVHRRGRADVPALLAGVACAAAGAMLAAERIPSDPKLAFAAPAVVAVALATRRWPSQTLVTVFMLASTYGTVTAFTPVPPGQAADVLLAGLWLGVLGGFVFGVRRVRTVIRPELLPLAAYVYVSLLAIAFAPDVDLGIRAFRGTTWYICAALLIAYGGWRRPTLDRLARALPFVALLVGAYATLRWAIGPAGREKELVAGTLATQYNQVAVGEDKVFGSFPNGQELGLWTSVMIPFAVAAALSWRGWPRLAAAGAVPLLLIGLFGSGQRSGLVAATAGVLVVVVVNQMSRGFRGPRLGLGVTVPLILVVGGALAFNSVVADSPQNVDRYERILTPERDPPFQERLYKWQNAFDEIKDRPFGHGLGTAVAGTSEQRFPGKASDNVDSSYVKVAYEQGFLVMVLFVAAIVTLLIGLARNAVWTRSRQRAAVGVAACGTLTAYGLQLAANVHISSFASLAAWIVVGLGVAQFSTVPRSSDPERPRAARRRPVAAG